MATPRQPKPLLALVTGRSLLADTIARLAPLIPAERVLILTSADIAPAIRLALPSVPAQNVLVEPRPAGTCAALAWGAAEIARRAGPDAVIVAIHADLAVGFEGAFRGAIERAAVTSVNEQALVALGARPTRAERGFGYLTLGAPLDADLPLERGGVVRAARFNEKPSQQDAEQLVRQGALWHAGIVVGDAKTFLSELSKHASELAAVLGALSSRNESEYWQGVRSATLERALLERTDRLLVMLADFGWDDVGTWASLRRARELDDHGNGALGAAHFVEASGNVVHTETGTVVLYGVSNLLVVTRQGITFVTTLDRSQDLKPLLDSLPGSLRIDPSRGGQVMPAE